MKKSKHTRPNSNVGMRWASFPTKRAQFPGLLRRGSKTLYAPRLMRPDRDGEQRMEKWLVNATKEFPWNVRARNRKANKVARRSRKINAHQRANRR